MRVLDDRILLGEADRDHAARGQNARENNRARVNVRGSHGSSDGKHGPCNKQGYKGFADRRDQRMMFVGHTPFWSAKCSVPLHSSRKPAWLPN